MLIISINVSNNAIAAEGVTILEKDAPAPYRGILFSEEEANSIYNQMETAKEQLVSLEKINALYKANEELYETKLNILLTQNVKLTSALSDSEKTKETSKIIWFAAGVGAVVLGAYATQAISR